nr:MAG TPA: hypothetical protein [Caudoviricetes sp.]
MLLQRLIVTNTRSHKVTSLLEERSHIFKIMRTFTGTLYKSSLKIENAIEWEGEHDVDTLRLSFTPASESQTIFMDVLQFFFSSEHYYRLFDIEYKSTPELMVSSREEKYIVFRVKDQQNFAFVLKPKSQSFFAVILNELDVIVRDKNDNIVIEVDDIKNIEEDMKNVLNKIRTLQNSYPNVITLSKEMLNLAKKERSLYVFRDNIVYYTYDSLSLLEDIITKSIEKDKVCVRFLNLEERNKLFTVINFSKVTDLLSILNDKQIDYEVHYRMPENGNTLTIHIYNTEIVDTVSKVVRKLYNTEFINTVSDVVDKFQQKVNRPDHH